MSNIEQNLAFILSSRYGEDVRQAIHDAIHDCYEDGKAGAVDLTAREQIANLVANAPSGSEKDSELVDIRVGYKGTTYRSAGEAVRRQVGKLSEDLDKLNEGGLVLKDKVIEEDINKWLDEHPEATTTIQDGAITELKIHSDFLPYIKKEYVTPEMFGAVGDGKKHIVNGIDMEAKAIQDAVDSGARVIMLLAGHNYYITKTINITTSITFCGNGCVSSNYGLWIHNNDFPSIITDNEFEGSAVLNFSKGCSLHDFGVVNEYQTANNNYVPTYDGIVLNNKVSYRIERVAVRGYKKGIHSNANSISLFRDIYASACIVCVHLYYTSDSIFENIYANTNGHMSDFITPSTEWKKEKLIGILVTGAAHYIRGGKVEWCHYGIVIQCSGFTGISDIILDWNDVGIVALNNYNPKITELKTSLSINNCWFMSRYRHITHESDTLVIFCNECVFDKSDGSAYGVFEGTDLLPEVGFTAYHNSKKDSLVFNNCDLSCCSTKTIFGYIPYTPVVLNCCKIGDMTIGQVDHLTNNCSY